MLVQGPALLVYIVRCWRDVWSISFDHGDVTNIYQQLICMHQSKQSQSDIKQVPDQAL